MRVMPMLGAFLMLGMARSFRFIRNNQHVLLLSTADMESPAAEILPHLDGKIWLHILSLADTDTKRKVRLVSRVMEAVANTMIRTMNSTAVVSTKTWERFPNAYRMRCTFPSRTFQQLLLSQLSSMVPRITSIAVIVDTDDFKPLWDGASIAEQLPSEFADNLQELRLGFHISFKEADSLLRKCSALRTAELMPRPGPREPEVWRPAAKQLTSLILLTERYMVAKWLSPIIDLGGLGSAQELQQLVVNDYPVKNTAVISKLAGLKKVSLSWAVTNEHLMESNPPLQAVTTAPLADLEALEEVYMPQVVCTAEQWAELAPKEHLHSVLFKELSISEEAPAAAAVTCLGQNEHGVEQDAGMFLHLRPAEGQLQGFLSRRFPRLQQLAAVADPRWQSSTSSMQQVLQALAGHAGLRSLYINDTTLLGIAADPQLQPFDLPKVRSIEISTDMPGDAVLAASAGCPELRTLLVSSRSNITEAGLAALAAGACSSSLEQLTLYGDVVPASPAVAVLLAGAMPRLQEVVVGLLVAWPGGAAAAAAAAEVFSSRDAAEAQMRQHMQQLLEAHGAAGAWVLERLDAAIEGSYVFCYCTFQHV